MDEANAHINNVGAVKHTGAAIADDAIDSNHYAAGSIDSEHFASGAVNDAALAGSGLDISKLSLDFRYEGSLSKLGESLSVGGSEFALDARPSQWIISLGFWFR